MNNHYKRIRELKINTGNTPNIKKESPVSKGLVETKATDSAGCQESI